MAVATGADEDIDRRRRRGLGVGKRRNCQASAITPTGKKVLVFILTL
jgi:hypothetical protein